MKCFVSNGESSVEQRLTERGVSRRDFIKFCGYVSATLGLAPSFIPKVAEALTTPQRPPVVWLSMAECTGCTEGLLRTTYPWIDEVVLDTISLDYHEALMAAAGHSVEDALHDTVEKYPGKFVCVVDGAIPTAEGGVYGMVAGRTMVEIVKEIVPKAMATIAMGTCAAYGGLPAAAPNPTGAKSVKEVTGVETLNVTGCPPNGINFVATVVNYLLFNKLPAVDKVGRPLFAFGKTIHDQCPRRAHFELGEFALSFDSEELAKGYCLYELGCKGPETYNNCPKVRFNDGLSWPVQAGHPCIGCSEPGFWDNLGAIYEAL
jgi:[NiFe] hydrogenase small subunit